jgi:N6-L-threonylcarbamoyladenine synthase
MMLALGIETSCDETAVAVVEDGCRIRASIVASQVERHRPFGGVVPEIAAREHVIAILPVLEAALKTAGVGLEDMDLIAVTDRPGLLSALLSGVAAAEALGLALDLPVIGVNHVEAHLVAPFLASETLPVWPAVSLVVSGGHSHLFLSRGDEDHLVLGATLDDAAGEAFDKVAKLLALGYPGGPAIQAAAEAGDPTAIPFKRPYLDRDSLDFSFSGLKTAVLYHCFGQDPDGRAGRRLRSGLRVADVAASFQAAVVDVLVEKVARAVRLTGVTTVAVGGGVACNGPLRERLANRAAAEGWHLLLAPGALCTDNAAMVAARGAQLFTRGTPSTAGPRAAARARWSRR